MYETVEEVFEEAMPKRFNASAAENDHGVYLFKVEDGEWTVTVDGGKLSVVKGSHDSPDAILTMTKNDYLDMVNDRESIQMLYMTGKLRVEGDLTFAVKLARYFPKK